uniref:hypothetical protein n=1 Tax=Paraburkholderia tropica TaxID=92647 RepID=UPI002AB31EA4
VDFGTLLDKACPVLATLAAAGETPDERLLALSYAYAVSDRSYRRPYVCGWLVSALPPERAVEHLISLCQLSPLSDAQRFIPIYEPLRLELLASAARNEHATWLGPISRWLCPTSWGSFALLAGEGHAPAVPLPALAFDVQRDAPLVAAILVAWKGSLRAPVSYAPKRWQSRDSMLPPQAAAHAFRLIRDARKLGLRESDDIILLSLCRVTLHPHLSQHPTVDADIKRAARGEARLNTLFETYDDAAWMRIVASLPQVKEYS